MSTLPGIRAFRDESATQADLAHEERCANRNSRADEHAYVSTVLHALSACMTDVTAEDAVRWAAEEREAAASLPAKLAAQCIYAAAILEDLAFTVRQAHNYAARAAIGSVA